MVRNRFIIPAIVFAISAIIASFFISNGLSKINNRDETINVTGSAKKIIVSDLGVLRGNLAAEAGYASEAYRSLQAQKPIILQYFKSKGFESNKVTFQTINYMPNYEYNSNGTQMGIRSYTASQTISIESSNVNLIKDISLDISSLVEKGVAFAVNAPEYYYTKIGDIKIEIQAAAAKDAMTRGQRIAEATGRKLGTLKSARMGVLQITPENSNMTSDYGINDASSIRKEITAVVSANFGID